MGKGALLLASMALAVLLASGLALAQTVPGAGVGSQAGSSEGGGEVVPREYIVVLEEDGEEPPEVAEGDEAEHPGLEVERVYGEALEGYAAEIPRGEVGDVENDPGVLFVAENRVLRRPESDQLGQAAKSTQVLDLGVDRVQADRSSTRSGDGRGRVDDVGIAVFDAGVDDEHPDLNVVGGKDCTSSGGYDDRNGHGTAVAGLAAARDNGFGVVGVAPGAPVYSVRVFDDRGFGTLATLLCGVDWVTANADKVGVANLSLSDDTSGGDDGACGRKNRDPLHYAICRSVGEGVAYVVAASNENTNLKNTVPAAYDEVLTATAITDFDGRPGGRSGPIPEYECQTFFAEELSARDDKAATFFSNYATPGSEDARHTIAAPGVCLQSTFPGNRYIEGILGTSFATPIVAGTAALYRSRHPDATPRQVRERLVADARARPASYGFKGDPRRPIGERYYGHLVHAGGY